MYGKEKVRFKFSCIRDFIYSIISVVNVGLVLEKYEVFVVKGVVGF